jgi:hypothetical protein
MYQPHCLRQQTTWDDPAPRDHHHGFKILLELWKQVVDQAIDILPG